MTKEQEAIEKLTNGEKIDFNTLVRKFKKEGIENFVVTKKEYIATVLNMLKEKDKKIEKLRNNNKDLLRKLRNRIKEVKKLERKDYKSIVTKQGKTLEERAEQLKKKDKIIDLMANSFAEEGFYSEHCQTLIDNEICPNDCDKCVKQYFERKVRDER